ILMDLRPLDLTGKVVAAALEEAGIVLNMNTIPFDPKGPKTTSGIRFGTPILTNRGMGADEMKKVAELMDKVIRHTEDAGVKAGVREEVRALCTKFPIYEGMAL
ncbi:MAG TPA: serine hydroxymethyltransferase, partial [Bacillota bacterium]|nr:serine hydroxymethyltransferase [Bacillota bacterium]